MKKTFLVALMALAILAGCKKETTNNDPVNPDDPDDPQPTTVDSSAWNIVAFLSKDIVNYADYEIYEKTDEGDVTIPCTLTPELADTTSSISLAYYVKLYKICDYISLSDIKPYKSNNEIMVYTDHARSFRIKLTRNSTPLPLDGLNLNCVAAIGAEPKNSNLDWDNLDGIKKMINSYGVNLSQNKDTAEARFQQTLTSISKVVQFDVKYIK